MDWLFQKIRSLSRITVCRIIAASFAALVVFPVALLVFARTPPVTILKTTVMEPAFAGQPLEIQWTAIASRNCEGRVIRRWIDVENVAYDAEPTPTVYRRAGEHAALGVPYTFSRDVMVPSGMAPGPAIMLGWREYRCNFTQYLWPIIVPIEPVQFTVLPAKK